VDGTLEPHQWLLLLFDTSCGKWYEQKEAENWLFKYTLCHQNCASWGRFARAGATKRIQFEFGDGRERHGENRISRRTYGSGLPRSQTYMKRTEWSSTRFGADNDKGWTASIQNETMEMFGWRCKNNCIVIAKILEEFFTMKGTLVACKHVDGLFKALNMSYCSDEWRLFIDFSKVSLKAVLLHNGNALPSIPVAHAFGIVVPRRKIRNFYQFCSVKH